MASQAKISPFMSRFVKIALLCLVTIGLLAQFDLRLATTRLQHFIDVSIITSNFLTANRSQDLELKSIGLSSNPMNQDGEHSKDMKLDSRTSKHSTTHLVSDGINSHDGNSKDKKLNDAQLKHLGLVSNTPSLTFNLSDVYVNSNFSDYVRLIRQYGYESTAFHDFKSPYVFDPIIYDDQAPIRKAPGRRKTKIMSCANCPRWFTNNVILNRDFRKCPYSECHFDAKGVNLTQADVVLFFPGIRFMPPRPPGQIWAFCSWESPMHYGFPAPYSQWKSVFNWTLTYGLSSELFFPSKRLVWRARDTLLSDQEYRRAAEAKPKTAAWFVSNCHTPSQREHYVKEMQKYIDVDIYGRCGMGRCSKSVCFKALNDTYKFYLGFENSICEDYVSEKLFKNFLARLHVIPVVRGGFDYDKYIPPNTFINAKHFNTAKALALYLKDLGNDLDRYTQMLKQKDMLIALNFKHDWCETCEKLHRGMRAKVIEDVKKYLTEDKCWHKDIKFV